MYTKFCSSFFDFLHLCFWYSFDGTQPPPGGHLDTLQQADDWWSNIHKWTHHSLLLFGQFAQYSHIWKMYNNYPLCMDKQTNITSKVVQVYSIWIKHMALVCCHSQILQHESTTFNFYYTLVHARHVYLISMTFLPVTLRGFESHQ